jgi:phage terminase small subunit
VSRARSPNRDKAFEIYRKNNGTIALREIAKILETPEKTISGWKSKDKWDEEMNGVLQKKIRSTPKEKNKKGAQPGNKNSKGPSIENKHAEKHGMFSKWLPEETMQILGIIQTANPIDLLWDNIQLQYAAILRAQNIMHVKDQDDLTKELKRQKESSGDTSDSWEKEYELQFAWDKQATFLQAQSRAMKTLESMIKQYDEMLHKNWELASEEQKSRVAVLKAKANIDDPGTIEDDGFIDAMVGKVADIWQED